MKINCSNCKKPIQLGTELCQHCDANTIAANLNPLPKREYKDAFLWIVVAIPIVVVIAFNIYFSFYPGEDFGMMFIQIPLLILWLFIVIFSSLVLLWRNLPKKAMSYILSFACIWPTSYFLNQWCPIGDYVHLAVKYPEYKTKIDSSPNTCLEFNWGVSGFVTSSTDRTLVYDPTDKLPQENKRIDAKLQKESDWLTIRHLFGHFYLVTQWHG